MVATFGNYVEEGLLEDEEEEATGGEGFFCMSKSLFVEEEDVVVF